MKHLILCFIVSFICVCASGQDYFQQTIDDTSRTDEQIFLAKIVPAPNGNFFVSGYERWIIDNDLYYRAIMMMIDSSGNMLWNKIFDKDSSFTFNAIVPFPDGCYVIGNFDSKYSYALLMKLDLEGNVTWSEMIENSDSSLSIDNMIAYNGGVLLSGHGYSSTSYADNVFLLKIDEAGNFTELGGYLFGTGFNVTCMVADGIDFYLLGWMWNGGSSSVLNNGIITRFNEEGNLLWAKKLKLDGGYGRTFMRAGSINEDRTINVAYDADDLFGNLTKIGLTRIDSNGNFLLEKEFATSLMEGLSIDGMSVSEDKQITIAVSHGDTALVFRYDENFNLIWSKSFDNVSDLHPLSLAETKGSNLMLSGFNYSTKKGVIRKITLDGQGCNAQDFFLENFNKPLSIADLTNYFSEEDSFTLTPISLTVSSPLVSYFGCDTLVSAVTEPIPSSIHLFPNPFNNTFKLTTNAYCEITIYDIAGRLLELHKNVTGEFSGGEKLLGGIYFIEIENTSGEGEMLKVVKME